MNNLLADIMASIPTGVCNPFEYYWLDITEVKKSWNANKGYRAEFDYVQDLFKGSIELNDSHRDLFVTPLPFEKMAVYSSDLSSVGRPNEDGTESQSIVPQIHVHFISRDAGDDRDDSNPSTILIYSFVYFPEDKVGDFTFRYWMNSRDLVPYIKSLDKFYFKQMLDNAQINWGLLQKKAESDPESIPYVDHVRGMAKAAKSLRFWYPDQLRFDNEANALLTYQIELDFIRELLAVSYSSLKSAQKVYIPEVDNRLPKVNKKRIKNGKQPLFSWTERILEPKTIRSYFTKKLRGARGSIKRGHPRIGHPRRFFDKKLGDYRVIYIKDTWVGPKDGAVVMHDYKLKDSND